MVAAEITLANLVIRPVFLNFIFIERGKIDEAKQFGKNLFLTVAAITADFMAVACVRVRQSSQMRPAQQPKEAARLATQPASLCRFIAPRFTGAPWAENLKQAITSLTISVHVRLNAAGTEAALLHAGRT